MDDIFIKNVCRDIEPLKVGNNSHTAVAVNIGLSETSYDEKGIELELNKAKAAAEAGADILVDLSIAGNIKKIRNKLLKEIYIPIGTVPLYETCMNAYNKKGAIINYSEEDIIHTIEEQAKEGIDIMTIHASFTLQLLKKLKKSNRIIPISSRGGAWIAGYMIKNNKENPLYSNFNEILDIMKEYEITISIGSALRPGSVVDGLDDIFLSEMLVQRELVSRAIKKRIPVVVEGVGHLSVKEIPIWVNLAKALFFGVPLRPLPIATDIGIGHDHISGAIAGAIAAINGADILCCITRAEHLGLPRVEDIKEATIAFKLASHIADIVKLNDMIFDKKISEARVKRNWSDVWKYALDGNGASELFNILNKGIMENNYCSMCGKLCAHKILDEYLKGDDV